MEQPDFVRFLFQGAQVGSIGMKNVSLERRSLGTLYLPDGRLFACDPLVPMDCAALECLTSIKSPHLATIRITQRSSF
jgi:hypothetical protein